jgi:hypothetical protein
MNNKKIFEEHDCEWKNESSCEDEVEDNGIDFKEVEGQEFGE